MLRAREFEHWAGETLQRSTSFHPCTSSRPSSTRMPRGAPPADPFSSHDLEDILVVVRGLPEVLDDIRSGGRPIHAAVRLELGRLLARPDALDLIRAHLEGDRATQAVGPRLLKDIRAACG